MLSLVMAFNLASLKLPPSRIISLALLLVLVIDPFTLLSAAFWLSFSAILIITYGMTARVNSRGLWWRWGRVQYLVAVGLTPLLTFWFHQVPLSSICANLIVVPWVSFITVPLVLLGSLMLWLNIQFGSWLLDLAMKSIDLFWPLLEILSQFEFSVFYLAEPGPAALIAAVIGVLLILMPTGLPGRWIGLVWLLPLLLPVADKAETGEARLSLLDVGQGLAAVVETRNHLLLFDTGPRYSDNFDAGSAVIKPFLQRKNIRHVDMLVQSHGDNDHIGGLANILATVSVERILSSVPEQIEHSKVNDCRNGQVWEWDGVSFEILHPAGNTDLSGNNRSCVLKVSAGESAILLTGDIEAKAEYRILARDREKLAATILVAPHHGSLSSSTEKFIAAVQPEFVLFPVGYRNRFGFPKQDIIRRYQERGIVSMDSARDGAIEMRIGTGDFTIRRYRQNARRFWHRTN
jgi:competence protein ComEC